jgi:hypothetical protein
MGTGAGRRRGWCASPPPPLQAAARTEVCIVGGEHYVRVAEAYLSAVRSEGVLGPGVRMTVIRNMIGKMRPRMRAWLEGDGARS